MSLSARGGQLDPVVGRGGILHHPLEGLEGQVGVAQRVGEIEDRVVGLLSVNTVQLKPPFGF